MSLAEIAVVTVIMVIGVVWRNSQRNESVINLENYPDNSTSWERKKRFLP
jgi:hypothetical protein